ncbi:Mitochondrial small ribosomal subunit Rsm22 [Popillia japonica]|uniref:Mitochondrial small ribosomal subunit Rsm22 n=1 Tax=Popillia japonica TaxID=7064 RepID=A0AAW1JYV9_POPJA
MTFKRILYTYSRQFRRKYTTNTNVKPKIEADPSLIANIENETYKPRQHPGIIKPRTVSLPPNIMKAIEIVLQDYPLKKLIHDSDILARHLKGRVPPMEENELRERKSRVLNEVMMQEEDVQITNMDDDSQFKQKVKDKVEHILKQKIYNWTPINYNTYNSLIYLVGRSAPEFAVLTRIFAELSARDVNFKPRSLFDFGSGVGTVTWAARTYWKDQIFENFNVDISVDMNDLAQIILQGGHSTTTQNVKGVFYRQFLPANNTSYDLVVSAYSMLELPSFQMRMETILRLWNKTSKYLVVVEQGTNAGFKVINEIRDFILQLQDEKHIAHVFSPCPHDKPCPRFLLNDHTPCNFEVGYTRPFIKESKTGKERYSYVIMKKGKRDSVEDEWPRLVRETMVKSKHSICKMCTANGNLTEVIFTASKHGKSMYHCARSSKWGDRLPITVLDSNDVK